jgi:hypothetical protein
MTKNLPSGASEGMISCQFLAAFAVVSTHQSTLGPVVGNDQFSLWVIQKKTLWPSRGTYNDDGDDEYFLYF